MTKDKSIYIQNIYYMLAYAFQDLHEINTDRMLLEEFETEPDLFALLLTKCAASLLNHGLYREYITRQEDLTVMRGKLNISGTIRNRIQNRQHLSCEYDELSENNLFNQILKTTMFCLIQGSGLKDARKIDLKKLFRYFDGIDLLIPKVIPWRRLYYRKDNRRYELVMNLCYLILEGMLQTTEKGDYLIRTLEDKHMEKLYELFILQYYKRHHGYLSPRAEQIDWNRDLEKEETGIRLLPKMQTDTMLSFKGKTLIIDAKYYTKALVEHHGKENVRNSHLYQIFAYVKNHDRLDTGNTAGLLMYARTDEEELPLLECHIGKNLIAAKALDLNANFKELSEQLDRIAWDFFPDCKGRKKWNLI